MVMRCDSIDNEDYKTAFDYHKVSARSLIQYYKALYIFSKRERLMKEIKSVKYTAMALIKP